MTPPSGQDSIGPGSAAPLLNESVDGRTVRTEVADTRV